MKNNNQIFGYIVLVTGLVLLFVTFFLAINLFLNPETMKGFSELVETSGGGINNLVKVMLYFFPLVLLLVMGSTGGRIASYGIKLVRSPENNSKDHLLLKEGAK